MNTLLYLFLALFSAGLYAGLVLLVYRPAAPYVFGAGTLLMFFLLVRICRPSEAT